MGEFLMMQQQSMFEILHEQQSTAQPAFPEVARWLQNAFNQRDFTVTLHHSSAQICQLRGEAETVIQNMTPASKRALRAVCETPTPLSTNFTRGMFKEIPPPPSQSSAQPKKKQRRKKC
ncbi:hypothetical protein MIR68_003874 [Amoeboaphelidium protococcarum]|nr:hypothetical protein MIR68_003874 [Amoeboaphelidium protococcarum]